ncbi:hypothetical protein PYCC9005_003908 [Savitreella phatthalungensis]
MPKKRTALSDGEEQSNKRRDSSPKELSMPKKRTALSDGQEQSNKRRDISLKEATRMFKCAAGSYDLNSNLTEGKRNFIETALALDLPSSDSARPSSSNPQPPNTATGLKSVKSRTIRETTSGAEQQDAN